MKDHEIRELVNALCAVAREYGQTQQLRERIAGLIVPVLSPPRVPDMMPGVPSCQCGDPPTPHLHSGEPDALHR